MDALFIKILNMSITASWLIIAVMFARLLIRRAPKWISCLLWGFVMIRLICPFSFESSLSVIPSREVIPHDIAVSESPAISTGVPAINSTLNPIMESLAPDAGNSVNPLQVWTAVGTWIWIAGIIAMLAYALVSYFKLKKQVAASVPLRDGVMACDEVKSPFILGVLRPVIYIPSGLAGDSLEYVLSHEEAHLRRKDHWWKPLGYLLLAVYWFNPLCWAAYILLSRDIEMACDEKVIRDMSREQTAGYSQALLNASCPVRGVRACPVAFGEVSVKQRIKGVLNYKKPAFWVIIVALILCVALGVTLLTDPADNVGGSAENAGDGYKVAYLENDIWEADGFMDKMLNPDMMAISSIEGCPLFRIDTMDDLEDFRSMIGTVADTSIDSEGMQSFDQAVAEYDEEFFNENSLMISCVHTSSEKFDVVLTETAVKDTYFYMFVERTGEQNVYSDNYWHGLIIKEMADQELKDVTDYVAQYGNQFVFGPYAADNETGEDSGDTVENDETEEEPVDNNESGEAPVSTGTFIKPVDAPITKGFGENSGKMHNGVDFAAEEGTPILASDGGTVVTADWVSAYGNCVEIDHGDGVMTRYAHCSKLLVSEGDSVSQGQTIAEVGSTGVSTGPHCHFEIIINDEAIDPASKLDLGE